MTVMTYEANKFIKGRTSRAKITHAPPESFSAAWASLAPPFNDHDLTRMKVSSAPTPDQNSGGNYFSQMK